MKCWDTGGGEEGQRGGAVSLALSAGTPGERDYSLTQGGGFAALRWCVGHLSPESRRLADHFPCVVKCHQVSASPSALDIVHSSQSANIVQLSRDQSIEHWPMTCAKYCSLLISRAAIAHGDWVHDDRASAFHCKVTAASKPEADLKHCPIKLPRISHLITLRVVPKTLRAQLQKWRMNWVWQLFGQQTGRGGLAWRGFSVSSDLSELVPSGTSVVPVAWPRHHLGFSIFHVGFKVTWDNPDVRPAEHGYRFVFIRKSLVHA